MIDSKPLIKRSHHIIVSDDGHISIGEIPHLSSVIRNPPAWVADALQRFDGTHTIQRVFKEVSDRHPLVRLPDIEALVEKLNVANLLENMDADLQTLTSKELERYDRQMLLYTLFDKKALPAASYQDMLKKSTAVVLGMGGWGTWICLHLALNGFGMLRMVDGNTVERSNLNRQVLYSDHQIGQPKVEAARATIKQINPHVNCELFNEFATVDERRLEEFISGSTIVFVAWASLGFYRKNTVAEKVHLLASGLRIPVCELGGDPNAISVGPIYPYDREKLDYRAIKAKNKGYFYHADEVTRGLQEARMKNQFDDGTRTVNAWQSSPSLSVMSGLLVDQVIKYITGYTDCGLVGKKFLLDLTSLQATTVETA